MSVLSENLKYYRTLSGLTVREITEKTGIPQQTYTGWELGNRQPRKLEDLDKVAKVFNISMDILLLDREGNKMVIEFPKKREKQDLDNLVRAYNELNAEARAKLSGYAEDLLSIERYRKNNNTSEK